ASRSHRSRASCQTCSGLDGALPDRVGFGDVDPIRFATQFGFDATLLGTRRGHLDDAGDCRSGQHGCRAWRTLNSFGPTARPVSRRSIAFVAPIECTPTHADAVT